MQYISPLHNVEPQEDNTTTATCCSVCGKKETPTEKLLQCSQCSLTSYNLCGKKFQRKDWKRHERVECLVLRVEGWLPSDPCACSLCNGDTEDRWHRCSKCLFNDLHMVRWCNKVYKFINDDDTTTNETVNGAPCNLVQVTLTEDSSIVSPIHSLSLFTRGTICLIGQWHSTLQMGSHLPCVNLPVL
jgi:hypothetical protein